MIYKIYSVRDNLSEEYAPPFVSKNDAVAVRQYRDLIRSQKLNPDEFGLYFLGTYETEFGVIESLLPTLVNNSDIDEKGKKFVNE